MSDREPDELPLSSIPLKDLLQAEWMSPSDGESRYELLVRLIDNANLTLFVESNSPPPEKVTSEVRHWAEEIIALDKRVFLSLPSEATEQDEGEGEETQRWRARIEAAEDEAADVHFQMDTPDQEAEVRRFRREITEEAAADQRFRREAADLTAQLSIDLHEVRITGADARRIRETADETLSAWPVDALLEDTRRLKTQMLEAKKARRRASAKLGKRNLQLTDARRKRSEPARCLKRFAQQLKHTELQRNPGCSDWAIATTITPAVCEEARRRFPKKTFLKGENPERTVYGWIHSKG